MTFPFGSQARRLLGVCLLIGGWLDGCDLNPQPHPPTDIHGSGGSGDFTPGPAGGSGPGANGAGTGIGSSSNDGGSQAPGSSSGGMSTAGGPRAAADAAASEAASPVPPPVVRDDASTGCPCEGVEAGSSPDAEADALAPPPADGTDGPAFPPGAPGSHGGGDAQGDLIDELRAMGECGEAGP